MIDFNHSFVIWRISNDLYGRFTVESSCQTFETKTSETKNYYLLSAVLACNVLKDNNMIQEPEYFFQAVFSASDFKFFRINNSFGNKKNSSGLNAESFNDVQLHIAEIQQKELTSNEEICEAVINNKIVNAKVNFSANEINYELQFPVKHINANISDFAWQIETGHVLMPLLSGSSKINAEHFIPAYTALNHQANFDYAILETKKNNSTFYQKKGSMKVDSKIYINKKI